VTGTAAALALADGSRESLWVTEAPLYRIHLIDEAVVVSRGERVQVWFVQLRDGWVRAHEHPEAELQTHSSERDDPSCPPGTIWQRQIELRLPRDTLLLRRTSEPLESHHSPLTYLEKGQLRPGRRLTDSCLKLVGNYRMVKVPPPVREASAKGKLAEPPVPRKSPPRPPEPPPEEPGD